MCVYVKCVWWITTTLMLLFLFLLSIVADDVVAFLWPNHFQICAAVLCLPLYFSLQFFFCTRQTLILRLSAGFSDICIAFQTTKQRTHFQVFFCCCCCCWFMDCRCAVFYLRSCNAHRRQQTEWKQWFLVIIRIIFLFLSCLRFILLACSVLCLRHKHWVNSCVWCIVLVWRKICDKMHTKKKYELSITRASNWQ